MSPLCPSDGKYEATASCQLDVRLVTMEMLHSAVTIRLKGMDQHVFLSPLLTYFQEALAKILSVDTADIFVVNVENDTDVEGKILNVTVSVRKESVIDLGQTRDVYYPPEYIREMIYLKRYELNDMYTVHVSDLLFFFFFMV